MHMKMYSDPVIELFSSTLMPTATLVTLPQAAQVPFSLLRFEVRRETVAFRQLGIGTLGVEIVRERG